MEWIQRFNTAIEYLEEHLCEEPDLERLGQLACCSSFHFQRMFSYIAGVPLSEYVRRRRMSRAAADLQNGAKVGDVACRYGYDSPTAFNRAFQKIHGAAPSQVKSGAVLRAYPPIRFSLRVTGGAALSYRVEEKPGFRVVGLSAPLEKDIEQNFAAVPGLWQKAAEQNLIPRLLSLADGQPMGILGVSACAGADQWRYYIAVSSSQEADTGLEVCQIPPATWAVFPGEGPMPAAIQELERRAVTEWLPTSGYEYADAPDIEVYLSPDPQAAKFEIWIPVRAAV